MKTSRFSEQQIAFVLRQAEEGTFADRVADGIVAVAGCTVAFIADPLGRSADRQTTSAVSPRRHWPPAPPASASAGRR